MLQSNAGSSEKSAPNSRGASLTRDRYQVNEPRPSISASSGYSHTLEDLMERRRQNYNKDDGAPNKSPFVNLDKLLQVCYAY